MLSAASCFKTTPAGQDSCKRCSEWSNSDDDIQVILEGRSSACSGCASEKAISVVSDQYRKQQPRWWIARGIMVVPIWVVERFARRLPRRELSLS